MPRSNARRGKEIDRNQLSPVSSVHFLLLRTFVMACRIVVPAFSTSFLVRPRVTQTFKPAGTTCLGSKLSSRVLRRVMRTPLARHCRTMLVNLFGQRTFCNTYFVNDILQQELLIGVRELLRSDNIRLEYQDENRILQGAGAINPITARV